MTYHSELCQPCGDCQWCQQRHEYREARNRWRTRAKAEHAKLERLRVAAAAFLDERGDEHGTIQEPGPAERALRRLVG